MSNEFNAPFEYRLIYVFRIEDSAHAGMVKVGEATIHATKDYKQYASSCSELNSAANARIRQYTQTAGIQYKLLYTEIAVYDEKQKDGTYKTKYFTDHKVHNVLKRSGVRNHYFDNNAKANEWFECDLETVKNAIKAVKNNQSSLSGYQVSSDNNPIIFRPEQEKAITDTLKQFEHSNKMLWNAKMRFGKTLSALEVIKRAKYKKSIIITHRPDVDAGWFDDFKKIFYERDTEYSYGSKSNGHTIDELVLSNKPFVYFASIQDLRGSIEVGGKYPKNDEVFAVDWDLVITDEAHEGTQTVLGKKVRERLINEHNKDLSLSGTPFNLFDLYSNDDTFTWDYIMEQEAKEEWMKDPNKLGDHNPYEELPKLNIFTYHLEKLLVAENGSFIDLDDKAFNFKEFFRVWTGDKNKDFSVMPETAKKGDFVHEDAVKAFLDLLCKKDKETNYPFSTDEYRDFFRHTLWMIPGVKEGKALTNLLKKHPVFGSGQFRIVNVAGNGDEDWTQEQKALNKLRKAIGPKPEETRTITISCGRLTTGVTVPEWTAVFMLSGSYSTDAKTYLQTIFRVQSPANINGKMKENCYVFDFAPDRTLKVIHEAIKKSAKKREVGTTVESLLGKFLNFCPVVSLIESEMKAITADYLLQEIKRVYTERVVDSGFEDTKLYNDELLKLDGLELEKFAALQKIIGKTKQTKKVNDVDVNNTGLTREEREKLEELKKKQKKKPLTEEEKRHFEELRKKQEQKSTAISILRGISIRIPLLVYGLNKDYDSEIKIEDLLDDSVVDPVSWKEFMPDGVTKDMFKDFIKYYDKDIFISACRKIRAISKNCDNYEPTERIRELVKLFAKFKNPDKETVLTPWRVVNLHMSETIGGYDFFDETHDKEICEPRYVNQSGITDKVLNKESKILEINSKTGLYPLYVTYSLYRERIKNLGSIDEKKKLEIWDKVVKEQVFVICKTPMAKAITKRTLLGYRNGKVNMHSFDDLIMQLKDKQTQFKERVLKPSFWDLRGSKQMKFNAVVGNPPYQEEGGNNNKKMPIYNFFWDASIKLSNFVSLITPARFLFNAGQTSKEWNKKMLNDEHLKLISYYPDSKTIFPTAEIKGGVCICIWDKDEFFEPIKEFIPDDMLSRVSKRFVNDCENNLPSIIFGGRSDLKFNDAFLKAYPESINDRIKAIQAKHPEVKTLSPNEEYELKSSTFEVLPYAFKDTKPNDPSNFYCLLGLEEKRRVYKWIEKKYMDPRYPKNNNISNFKVFLPESNGDGKFGEVLSNPVVGKAFDSSTPTFISIGNFASIEEAENLLKYLKTKTVRALLSLCKKTQHNPRTSWAYVPLQNFTNQSDIDWNGSIEELDKQLYKKYKLDDSEIDFIESNVQKMS